MLNKRLSRLLRGYRTALPFTLSSRRLTGSSTRTRFANKQETTRAESNGIFTVLPHHAWALQRRKKVMRTISGLCAQALAFLRETSGNLTLILALSAIPVTLAMGAGVDYARGLVVHSNMADALDAAALAVGKQTTKPTSCSTASGSTTAQQTSCATLKAVAQQFFNANYKRDSSSTGATPTIVIVVANEAVTLSATDSVPTTFLRAADTLLGSTALQNMAITASSTVVWGQTKLWVSLVLDNSGSMSKGDSDGTKMEAMQTGAKALLTSLQNASTTAGDVKVGIVPFTRMVNVNKTNVGASWIYWGFWEAAPQISGTTITDSSDMENFATGNDIKFAAWGPGDDCPFTTYTTNWSGNVTISRKSPYGFYCTESPPNASDKTEKVPGSGTYKGYICPGVDNGTYNTERNDRYYNGCWTSTKDGNNKVTVASGSSSATCNGFSSSNCSCTGSNSGKSCKTQKWTHVWVPNNHSTWNGCVTDRQQDYDIANTTPTSGTDGFPADNPTNCPDSKVTALNYSWTTMSTQIDDMDPDGSTNQAIGVAHGWQMLTNATPYSPGALPSNTTRYMIVFSDGLNTQNRWWGDGSTEGTTDDAKIDARMKLACDAAKLDGVVVYAMFVHVGTNGSSDALEDCATTGKYYDLTTTAQIATAFADIAQQITNLRVTK